MVEPQGRSGLAVWKSPEWREQAVAWLDRQLAGAGIARTGEVTQPHLRPWSTVLRAPTTRGPVWLKAPGPGTVFEVALYRLLARVVPDRVLIPLATDLDRGWLLLPDGGPTLRQQVAEAGLAGALATILPQYGQLQRDLARHAGELLAIGVSDMRPAAMPARFDEALDAVRDSYLAVAGSAADRAAYQRVAGFRGNFAGWCRRLAELPGEPSLDHNDLHPGNILWAGTGPARFYDWGDSVLAHPFASLLVGLGYLGGVLGAGPEDPRLLRVRDAYLAVFSDLAPHRELVEAVELTGAVGKVARALTWHRALQAQGYDRASRDLRAPLEWLLAVPGPGYRSPAG